MVFIPPASGSVRALLQRKWPHFLQPCVEWKIKNYELTKTILHRKD